ncbi:hypothetical protein FKW77_009701 [Venturia effusa]|uniref:FAS1 domain-containing protein n=1 Tax=Venturia effusa TaxID=50376 RepID=A0A517L227_9PEZI|nr:hypothetical protein FKW77_009701 [Venturia effusa]
MAIWWAYWTVILSLTSSISALTLLSAIAADPELSTLKAVIAGMGTSPGRPDPALEERFNSKLDGRQYTFFAPTNAAFAKLPASQVKALLSPSNYQLLLAIIRTHVAEGYFPASAVAKATKPITSIEGFPLSLNGTKINSQAKITATDFEADNGIFHKIDTVLNPFTSYFGLSSPIGKPPGPNINEPDTKLRDLLLAAKDLTIDRNISDIVTPNRLIRFTRPLEEGEPLPLFLVFSNTAYSVLPPSSYSSFIAPTNNALSAYLLEAGRIDNVTGFGKTASSAIISKIKAADGKLALKGGHGLDILFRQSHEDENEIFGLQITEQCTQNFWQTM